MRLALLRTATVLALMACPAYACSSKSSRESDLTQPPAAPAGVTTVPQTDEMKVWDSVVAATGAYIKPILRPASWPAGFTSVSTRGGKGDPRVFQVRYDGPGRVLRIQAGLLNPSPPPAGGSKETIELRGQPASLVIGDVKQPSSEVRLWWEEPGELIVEEGKPAAHWLYELIGEGIEPDELVAIAEALRPYP